MATQLTINDKLLPELREMQAALGCVDLKSTTNLLLSLGTLAIREALKGGEIAIVHEAENRWDPISHPALEQIKEILREVPPKGDR